MIIIGVTGSFGTGKTTVARMFKGLGAVVLDADRVAHQVLSPKAEGYRKILKVFGRKILGNDKEIDRRKLGRMVFSAEGGSAYGGKDKSLLKKLNSVVHPYVIKRIKEDIERIRRKTPEAVIILDVPLLIEAGLLGLIDKLILVKTDRKTQVERCRKKMGLGRQEVLARIRAQMPIAEKIRFSDFVIDNSGTRNRTKREVGKIWQEIQRQTMQKRKI